MDAILVYSMVDGIWGEVAWGEIVSTESDEKAIEKAKKLAPISWNSGEPFCVIRQLGWVVSKVIYRKQFWADNKVDYYNKRKNNSNKSNNGLSTRIFDKNRKFYT